MSLSNVRTNPHNQRPVELSKATLRLLHTGVSPDANSYVRGHASGAPVGDIRCGRTVHVFRSARRGCPCVIC